MDVASRMWGGGGYCTLRWCVEQTNIIAIFLVSHVYVHERRLGYSVGRSTEVIVDIEGGQLVHSFVHESQSRLGSSLLEGGPLWLGQETCHHDMTIVFADESHSKSHLQFVNVF